MDAIKTCIKLLTELKDKKDLYEEKIKEIERLKKELLIKIKNYNPELVKIDGLRNFIHSLIDIIRNDEKRSQEQALEFLNHITYTMVVIPEYFIEVHSFIKILQCGNIGIPDINKILPIRQRTREKIKTKLLEYMLENNIDCNALKDEYIKIAFEIHTKIF